MKSEKSITRAKANEVKLWIEKESSSTLFNQITNEAKEYAIFLVDPDGVILSWNPGAERMKQFTSEEAIGHNYEMLYCEEDRKVNRPQKNIKHAIESGKHEEQWWRRKKDGTVYWADAITLPIFSPSGELLGLSKIVRDLSEKKRAEIELKSTKESSDAASVLKSIFIANMSHEIRTPLGAILGFSDVLREEDCSPENRLMAGDSIERNGKILLRLIDDILDLSKIEAGKFTIEKSSVQVRTFVKDVVSGFEVRAREKGLILKIETDANVSESICTDPIRLGQILGNVIGNAVKFTEKGEVNIEVHHTELPGGGGSNGLEFIVTDTGLGLTGDERKNLFIPFSQADSSATRKFGGTGLGLALSRKLTEKLGGEIGLMDFKSGTGCSFRITIANMDHAYEEKHKDVNFVKPNETIAATVVPKNIVGTKVLIVDDSLDNQMLIKVFLDKWGVLSDSAENGAVAIAKATKDPYDLILMDLQMPVMDGNEAMRSLRKSGYVHPIVVITAHAMNEEKAKAFDSGCDDFLIKPINKNRLHEILETYASPGVAALQ